VKAGTEEILLPLYVAKGWGVPLLGRNWFAPLGIKLTLGPSPLVAHVESGGEPLNLPSPDEYPQMFECFQPGLGQ